MRLFRRWPAVEAFLGRLVGRFTTSPVRDFDRFVGAAFEMRFMKLHAEGGFDEMWDMIAEDAQRAWGGQDTFMRDMTRLGDDTELLDVQVLNAQVLPSWTDPSHDRVYSNVAQMDLRYHVREQWKDWTLDRQVHLILEAGGWRTLFYPTKTKSGAASR